MNRHPGNREGTESQDSRKNYGPLEVTSTGFKVRPAGEMETSRTDSSDMGQNRYSA